jgi:hypothetical protein
MKKHKSVVAILLAVMMIFTMMPMMAFAKTAPAATDKVVWASDYSKVTVNGVDWPVVRTAEGTTWNGLIKATTDDSKYAGSAADAVPDVTAYYYDFNGAKLAIGDAAVKEIYTKTAFDSMVNGAFQIQLAMPSYVANIADYNTAAKKLAVINSGIAGWTWTANVSPEFDPNEVSYTDRSFTVTLSVKNTGTVDVADPAKADYIGSVAPTNFTVQADKASAGDIAYYVDSVKAGNEVSKAIPYDGKEHKVVAKDVPGFTVSYEVLNTKTGKYEAASEVVVKDAGQVTVQPTVTDKNGKATKAATFTVTVAKADAPIFAFAKDDNKQTMTYDVKEGEEYDVNNYVEMFPGEVPSTVTDADAKKARAAANKAAAKADAAQWNAYFKALYDVTATPGEKDPSKVACEIAKKELSTAEEKEALKPFEALLANYETPGTFSDTTSVTIVPASDWYEIEFTKSPTKKTFKAKVLKKKAKSFKVHAEATNGEAVVYKLINAPEKIVINKTTGKITLKKGLKKGTYKIRVRAYIPKTYSLAFWNPEEHAITIKVTK